MKKSNETPANGLATTRMYGLFGSVTHEQKSTPESLDKLFKTVTSRPATPEPGKIAPKEGTLAGLVEHRLLNW